MKLELSWSEEEVQGGDEELSLMFLNPSLIKSPFDRYALLLLLLLQFRLGFLHVLCLAIIRIRLNLPGGVPAHTEESRARLRILQPASKWDAEQVSMMQLESISTVVVRYYSRPTVKGRCRYDQVASPIRGRGNGTGRECKCHPCHSALYESGFLQIWCGRPPQQRRSLLPCLPSYPL